MNSDTSIAICTALIGIITAIMVGVIPWAMKITNRLTSIETKVEFFRKHGPSDVRTILDRIEKRLKENGNQ